MRRVLELTLALFLTLSVFGAGSVLAEGMIGKRISQFAVLSTLGRDPRGDDDFRVWVATHEAVATLKYAQLDQLVLADVKRSQELGEVKSRLKIVEEKLSDIMRGLYWLIGICAGLAITSVYRLIAGKKA